jgi:hypothetical protein
LGHIGLSGFWGNYLTATSTYSSTVAGALSPCCGVNYPAGDYGIFSSNATNGWFKNSYASNMADAAFYIGACQQQCDQVMQYDRGENSSLCLSSTNAGDYPALGNVSENNQFSRNGFFGNPSNGDIGLATAAHNPGNCFSGDSIPDGTDPAGIETNPLYQPSDGMRTNSNAGDEGLLASQAVCASQLFAPCPSAPGAKYPRPDAQFSLPPVPSNLPSMPDPCAGVPKNPWCP